MRQLWINNKRMDGIAQLQQEFASADQAAVSKMCAQVLKQCEQDGSLIDWLMRQPERALPKNTKLPVNREIIEKLIKSLQEHPGTPDDVNLLAALCGIDAALFTDAAIPDDGRDKKIKLLEKQLWWFMEDNVLDLVSDWSRVVTSSSELNEVLLNRKKMNQNEAQQLTIYLCNTGSIYFFNPLVHAHSVRFIGCGNPELRLDPRQEYSVIDMDALQINLEDLTLRNSYGVHWKGWKEHTKNCMLIEKE